MAEYYREIVDRFDRIARANLEAFSRVSVLCRAVGVSRRTLARAFWKIHATTPVRYLHGLRLTEARTALLKDVAATTVTEVATRFGFSRTRASRWRISRHIRRNPFGDAEALASELDAKL